ncbi:MAG: alpha/beta hydrolase family esterase [Acidobacteriota bacterium]
MRRHWVAWAGLVACGPPPAPAHAPDGSALVAARPYELHVPPSYDAAHPAPLVLLLHGFTDSAKIQDAYFRVTEVADREGFLVALPDGTKDAGGNEFWNADDACCDFGGTHVDDVAYLGAVLDDAERRYRIDPARVYVLGHSNGGFMAYRLACELAPRIAAVAAHAGAPWLDASKCRPAARVSLAAIYGDADSLVHYGGGALDDALLARLAKMIGTSLPPLVPGPRAYPSAHETVARWAKLDGCTGPLAPNATLDLDTAVSGAETEVAAYGGCADGTAVELWTMHGVDHMPDLAKRPAPPSFMEAVWAFFAAHPRAPR